MAAKGEECSICMDNFKTPKLIPCHHTFCCKCLEDYVQVNLSNGRFKCPICRKNVKLPKGGVSAFQTNFYIDTNSNDKFLCDLCGPKSVACSRCLDCEENLCKSCCYVHEKLKVSKHHKISDLGTLDSKMKGKIQQRIYCDQHPEEEIKLMCRNCNILICVLCKAVNHENHAAKTVADAAEEIKVSLQAKINSCLDKLNHIKTSKDKVEKLERSIDDAELEELKVVEDQHLQLNQILDQEVAKVKDKIKNVYHNLRQKNSVFKRDVQEEFKTCFNANDNVQKLIGQGTDIEILKKGPELEKLISEAISKVGQTSNTQDLKNKLFMPAKIEHIELISLIGNLKDSTDSQPYYNQTSMRPSSYLISQPQPSQGLYTQQQIMFMPPPQYSTATQQVIMPMTASSYPQRMSSTVYQTSMPNTQQGLFQLPQQNTTNYTPHAHTHIYNNPPAVFYNAAQQNRPPSASGMSGPGQLPAKKKERTVMQIIDPNSGKDIMQDLQPTRSTPPSSGTMGSHGSQEV
ncbi:hypothetical protein CHS0354_013236 [Potamilus streckersoni]|uniref:Uncharacterized protein n=1 Tax=Potamilus streckersoni TaxID=2493646 RepID=A0AAE0T1T6_9BIVA|nr:hypothetical protein CHS0354_013236 [Potamilus streckersoni]